MPRPPAGVMHVALSLDPGGTERLVVELAKRASIGFRVSVCCLDAPGAWAPELTAAGIDVFGLNRGPGFRPSLALEIARQAKRRAVRILHCHHYSPLVYGSLARLRHPRLRLVFTEHGRLSDALPTRKRRMVTPMLAALADEMYAVSDDLRRYLITSGFPAGHLRVIHNGIAVGCAPDAVAVREARGRLTASDSELIVAAVGRLDPVKDLATLMRAMGQLRPQRARLLIIGDGPERLALTALASALGLDSVARFVGHREDVRALLPGVDVFVNSSISEGISLTLLEAMSARLAVVATAVGGTPEVVVDGVTGRLVPAREPAALARAIDELLDSADLRRRMGAAGRARVEAHFTLDRMAAEYLTVYDRLAG